MKPEDVKLIEALDAALVQVEATFLDGAAGSIKLCNQHGPESERAAALRISAGLCYFAAVACRAIREGAAAGREAVNQEGHP